MTQQHQNAYDQVDTETLKFKCGLVVVAHAGRTRAAAISLHGGCQPYIPDFQLLIMSLTKDDTTGMTQLVRYVLTIDNMCAPDCIGWVREQLTRLELAVDRVVVGEAEVATAHINGPDLMAIQAALEAGGYQLVRSVTKVM